MPCSTFIHKFRQKRLSTTQANSGSQTNITAGTKNGAGLIIKGRSATIVRKQPSSLYGHVNGESIQLQKAPLKEQNRIIGSSQSIASNTTSPTSNGKTNFGKPGTHTELQELQHNNNNNNKHFNATTARQATTITTTTVNENDKTVIANTTNNITPQTQQATSSAQSSSALSTIATTTTTQSTRSNSQTPSPILGGQHGKKLSAIVSGSTLLERKSVSKLQTSRSKVKSPHNQTTQQQQQQHLKQQQQHSIDDASLTIPNHAEYLDAAELKRLKHLNRHSCNGRLNYAALERYLEEAELREAQQDKSVEALGVLLQYLVYDLDAFACPAIKKNAAKFEGSLQRTVQLLEDARSTCTQLQEQLCDKEAYYTQREEELQELHRCEMAKAQANLSEYQAYAQQKQNTVEALLHAKEEEHKRTLDSYRLEMENKFAQQQQQQNAVEERELELKARLSASQLTEQSLQQQLVKIEHTYANRFQIAGERENELNERLKALSKELEEMRVSKENREQELRDKLNLTQDEVAVLRLSRKSANDSITELRSSFSNISSPRNSSSAAMSSSQEILRLQSEAESLRCVLELKQKEISKLTKHNEELLRDADERAALQAKISLLESRNEMLQSELEIKSEKEKDYQRQIEEIQKAYNHEIFKRKRLSYDNEELQWHLKQRSEQLHIVEAKLQELSTCDSNSLASNTTVSSLNRTALQNGAEDISPPTSPIIKGVIQKHDSVSWVLEMDDETPEVAASKMVKRASSFRSVERSPSTRRHLSVSASAVSSSSMNTSINGGAAGDGPNPLSQSMSATSVIRQHSSNTSQEFGSSRAHARIRSKSVSVKSSEPSSSRSSKKLMRQNSTNGSKKEQQKQKQEQQQHLELHSWQAPISSSSPYCGATRPRSSTMIASETQGVVNDEELYRRTATISAQAGQAPRKLITCDTSALNSGERLDMHALPTHSSVHDLKVLKKCQEIQESAGEAMVSGTNSEDEGCSASSDEIVCSASNSTGTTGSTSSLNHMKNSHMSMEEEELLLEKINSLNGTPMEVSWSDDAEVFANGATL